MVFGCLFWTDHHWALAACRRLQWAAFEADRGGRQVKVKGGLCRVESAERAVPIHPGGIGREARVFLEAAAEQTQPWPTSRPKGSSGSSKKLSKAKRCGNATACFHHDYARVLLLFFYSRCHVSTDTMLETKNTSANVRAQSRFAVGQA